MGRRRGERRDRSTRKWLTVGRILVSALRRIQGKTYPYWWQKAFWLTPSLRHKETTGQYSSQRSVVEEVSDTNALVIYRSNLEGINTRWGASIARRAMADLISRNVSRCHEIDSSIQGAPSVEHILGVVAKHDVNLVIVIDLYALDDMGVRAPLTSKILGRKLRRLGIPINTILWDLLDPAMAYMSNSLVGQTGQAFSLASTTEEASTLGIRNARGPATEWIFPGIDEHVSPTSHDFGARQYDLYLPPLDHISRRARLTSVLDFALASNLALAPSSASDYLDYMTVLGQSRITVVTNAIREAYRARLSAPLRQIAPSTHAVGRNFEAVAAGSLLIAEKTPGLRYYFDPNEHYLEWTDSGQATAHVRWALAHPQEAQKIARAAQQRFRDWIRWAESNPDIARIPTRSKAE